MKVGKGLLEGLAVTADDYHGVLRVSGTPAAIQSLKSAVGLFDIEPASLHLQIQIDSPADKSGYEVSARIHNDQMWKTSDSTTDLTIGLKPRINDDGTVTIFTILQNAGGSTASVVRIHPDQPVSLVGPNQISKETWICPWIGEVTIDKLIPAPTVKLTLLSN
jgi:hypothetical protein